MISGSSRPRRRWWSPRGSRLVVGGASSCGIGRTASRDAVTLKVLYDDVEVASVRAAAQLAGLTPTGFVAAAGLTVAGSGTALATSADRALLAELLQARTALRRYGVNLNQAVGALNSGGGAPVWLLQAVSGCARASQRIDDATVALTRRLG
jgi:hypothetical protein